MTHFKALKVLSLFTLHKYLLYVGKAFKKGDPLFTYFSFKKIHIFLLKMK